MGTVMTDDSLKGVNGHTERFSLFSKLCEGNVTTKGPGMFFS